MGEGQLSHCAQHHGQGMLSGCQSIPGRGVQDNNTLPGGRFNINVIHAHTGSSDDLQVLGLFQDSRSHIGPASRNKGMIRSDILRELISLKRKVYNNLKTLLGTENVDTLLINGIGDENFHSYFL